MKNLFTFFLLFTGCWLQAQEISSNYRIKKVVVQKEIQIDSVAINNTYFEIRTLKDQIIPENLYNINFQEAKLTLSDSVLQNNTVITIYYLKYPEFITKVYSAIDPSVIVNNNDKLNKLYSLQQQETKTTIDLFDGLNTSGSISRGITVGNNQNAVVNSQLDLQISGQLANDITLRASIKDANIPIQESGYSQRLEEFDQIFIELASKNWNIRAGDINLQNSETYFMNFTKKVQGILIDANLTPNRESTTEVFASGAVVRGRYTNTSFTGEEGNQGPYKLTGSNDELYILIVSGSERVYVNGTLLTRGENNDYVMDYSSGELTFTSKYPVTSDMRIKVEYQYTDNNYTRYVTYGGVKHTSEKLNLNGYVYAESDAKNRPVQENLSEEQVAILQQAGDDTDLMTAPSAVEATYDENRIQYEKITESGTEYYAFSTDETASLYNVTFTLVGANQGNYVLSTTLAAGKVFEYVAPVAGVPQGNYEPITTINAPTKTQVAVLNGAYKPTEKTNIQFETAMSNNDENLFSEIDDQNNTGAAAKISVQQQILAKTNSLTAFADVDYISENFQSIERIYNIEFNRDWNLETTPESNQSLVKTGLTYQNPQTGTAQYRFEYLDFSGYSHGGRHVVTAALHPDKFNFITSSSYLKSNGIENESTFARSYNTISYSFPKNWIGAQLNFENNQQTEQETQTLTDVSQRFQEYKIFTGIGDSTNVFAEVGYKFRVNDSIRSNELTKFNTSNTYYINSQLIQNQNTQLGAFVSFRNFDYEDEDTEDENSLNSRIIYSQRLWKGLAQWNTTYETNAGTIAMQEFAYVEVDAGQGTYTWNDYNENGIQELDEFEVAQYQDQATYVRVLLANQIYQKTHQNKFSQTLSLNPGIWQQDTSKLKDVLRHFYNQTSFLIDRKITREGSNFNLNPFGGTPDDEVLGLNQSIQNTFFFNRGKQHFTTSYTFVNTKAKTLLAIGSQESGVKSHQLKFAHRFNDFWLMNFDGNTSETTSASENYESRNYDIDSYAFNPKISYLFNLNSKFDLFYQFENKQNQIGEGSLQQHNIGASFSYANMQKVSLNGEFNYFKNNFEGNAYSPVGYQILEGLQTGNNFTWTLIAQKQLTKFLDLNVSYFGRKSEDSKTIHTGTVQLKAYF
ncbi:hypothetical protein SAMN05216480_10898 [Pustulibacterium marinum]|uniref:Uncharacterized protein n=1 Tax=Pustulibacterium marinum TaxID=1224947 RepID=A0A1I7HC58_9FLAO|nr:hypothetical protein [Pustulibacterium marinum]SFU58189.1 hypothetical protein SAMN05216480_10898 [Pustulibacterium marinum]